MPKSVADAELRGLCDVLATKVDTHRQDISELWAADEADGRRMDELTQQVAELRTENAVLRQRLDDHLQRVELWDARRWGLVVAVALALLGSALAFASGLILATLRTTPK